MTTLSSVALAGLLTTSVITLSDVHHPTVAYAATTTNQKNALRKAKSYYKTMNMSKQGIYDQLTSEAGENFSEEDAQYAIDHLKVNYKKAALKKDQGNILFVVECKKPNITEGYAQLVSYIFNTSAIGGVWTNGEGISVYKKTKDGIGLEEILSLPRYRENWQYDLCN